MQVVIPLLLVLSGLPGTGKSALANAIGRALTIPVFGKDWLEAALWRSGIKREMNSGWASYELLTGLAESQLQLGQSAILDSVATFQSIRQRWQALAVQYGAAFKIIECVCSDESLHRTRLEGRSRGIPGWYELDWREVKEVQARYEPWSQARLIVDAVNLLDSNVQSALNYLAV